MLKRMVETIFHDQSSLFEQYYNNLLLDNEGLGFPSVEEAKQDLQAALAALIRGF